MISKANFPIHGLEMLIKILTLKMQTTNHYFSMGMD